MKNDYYTDWATFAMGMLTGSFIASMIMFIMLMLDKC